MSKRHHTRFIFAGVFLISLVSQPAAAQYFKGKTVTLLVGYATGGGVDASARIFAKFFGKHVPGNPTFIVQNMTGGGGVAAQNYVYEKAKPDGLTILFTPVAFQDQVLGNEAVRYDYAKSTIIGPLLGEPIVMFARTDVVPGGLKAPKDILKATDLKFGGLRPTGALDMLGYSSLDLLGLKYKYVRGYTGASAVRMAVQRDEVNIATHGLAGFRQGVEPSMVKEGVAKGLWYYPAKDINGQFVKSSEVTDMPSFIEFYKAIRGKEPSGQLWEALELVLDFRAAATNMIVGPPSMDEAAKRDLRKGFEGVIRDPEVIAEQEQILGFHYKPVPLAQAERVTRGLSKVDPKLVGFWKDYIARAAK